MKRLRRGPVAVDWRLPSLGVFRVGWPRSEWLGEAPGAFSGCRTVFGVVRDATWAFGRYMWLNGFQYIPIRVFSIEDGQPPRRRVRRLLFVPGSLGNWGCFQQAECMLEARAKKKAPYPLVQSFMSFPQARANPIFPRCHPNPPYLAFECTDFQDVRTDSIGKSEGLADVML